MNNLEKFIQENREQLDTARLRDKKWEQIASDFHKRHRLRVIRNLSVAASFIIIASAGIWAIFDRNAQDLNDENTIVATNIPDIKEEESSLIMLINNAKEQLKNKEVPSDYRSMFDDFINQLDILDNQNRIYQEEINKNGYSEEIVQQVIYNYQLRLSVLQMLQKEIEKINEMSKVNEDEKVILPLKL